MSAEAIVEGNRDSDIKSIKQRINNYQYPYFQYYCCRVVEFKLPRPI